jgi:hypothetical protein
MSTIAVVFQSERGAHEGAGRGRPEEVMFGPKQYVGRGEASQFGGFILVRY